MALSNPAVSSFAEPIPPPIGQPATAPPVIDASPYASPYTGRLGAVPNPDVSPGLAFLLGLIPGVGAIYNGQYAKGLVHAIIVGLMISIMSQQCGQRAGAFAELAAGGILGLHGV